MSMASEKVKTSEPPVTLSDGGTVPASWTTKMLPRVELVESITRAIESGVKPPDAETETPIVLHWSRTYCPIGIATPSLPLLNSIT
jgi:hypothetical protein